MFRRIFAWANKYERHLSALAMIAGFAIDQLFYGRIDLPVTQAFFQAYLLIAGFSIAIQHWIEARAEQGKPRPRFRWLFPTATQFALGGLWSGFFVFYGRSAALEASWPFVALLVAFVIANEVFRKYHERIVFTSVLFFFAIYSYAIFAVPVYLGRMGDMVFIGSGILAAGFFVLFTMLLRLLGNARYSRDVWRIRVGALAVLVLLNIFYFSNILPPLPLALKQAGVYHSVVRTDTGYTVLGEAESWYAGIVGQERTEHVARGESLYLYSAVFAPIKLSTTIINNWQLYNADTKKWETKFAVSYPINGGRDGGYRGYSSAGNPQPGLWRVDIETIDGRLIGRETFTVAAASTTPALGTSQF